MSRATVTRLEDQLSTTTHELELATFLNKGILQTNTEYKLRIAELEGENAALRKAESKLAETEDYLEASEQEVKRLEEERDGWEDEANEEREKRKKAELEVDDIGRELEKAARDMDSAVRQRQVWEDKFWEIRSNMEKVIQMPLRRGDNPQLQTQVPIKAINKIQVEKYITPRGKPKPRATQSTSRASRKPPSPPPAHLSQSSPVRRPQRSVTKKRKRLAESEDEEEDEYLPEGEKSGGEDPLARLASPQEIFPVISQKAPTISALKRYKRTSNQHVKVKDEPISPGDDWQHDDEDDPL